MGLDGDRILVGTQAGSRKARNLDRDPRVALSLTDHEDPYRTAHLRGRVVDRIAGEAAQAAMDRMARRYAGRDFPKLAATVVYASRSSEPGT